MSKCVYYRICVNTPDQCEEWCSLRGDKIANPEVEAALVEKYDKLLNPKSFEFKEVIGEIGISLSDLNNLVDLNICQGRR